MRLTNFLPLFALLLFAIGCGGGGVAGGGGTAGGGSLFLTDSLDSHDHVWVTIKKVVLNGAGGNATIYDDSVGRTIDLKTLRDGSGERYSFLAATPAGTYTGISVTVDKTVTLYNSGNPTGFTRLFAGNDGTNATLSLTFATSKTIAAGNGFALDFDLSNWTDDGTLVSGAPFLGEGLGNGLNDDTRHEHDDFKGSVQGLAGTSPDQTFSLVRGGRSVAVITNAQTVVFNSNGATSPHLANGERVEVRGAFSVAQNAIVADAVKIEDNQGNDDNEQEVNGTASSINAGAGTFVLTVLRTHHFTPPSTTLNVVTSGSTVFVSDGGVTMTAADFFAALTNGQEVEAEGTFNSGSNTLTATKVKLEDEGDHHHEAEIKGPASTINSGAGTFDVTAQQWEGINLGPNHLIHVVTNGSTSFGDHGSMTAQQFFTALTNGQQVEVEGGFDPDTNTLTALKAKLDD